MQPAPNSSPGLILIHANRAVYADMHAARILSFGLDALSTSSLEDILMRFKPADRERLQLTIQAALSGAITPLLEDLCLEMPDGARFIDAWVDRTLHHSAEVLRIIWLDRATGAATDEPLRRHVQRLQLLHEIDGAVLAGQDEGETVRSALSRIAELTPQFLAGAVLRIEPESQLAHLVGVMPANSVESSSETAFQINRLPVDLSVLGDGLPYIVHDLTDDDARSLLERILHQDGVLSYLAAPLRWGGGLIGMLLLAAGEVEVFQAEHVQIAQESADSLAVALHEADLHRAEVRRRQETDVMRDVMAALASAGDLRQMLEALVVNLRNLIDYDRAGLILVDENEQMVRADRYLPGLDSSLGFFPEAQPVVMEMRTTRRPVIVPDLQVDQRFADWPDVESVRGWLGAPLMAGERMLGFISIGALRPAAYSAADAETMDLFASEVSKVLERAWLDEQVQRRNQQLDVLSNMTFALGQMDGSSDTLAAILVQVAQFFGAGRAVLWVHDRGWNALVVKASLDPALLGEVHPFADDELWQTLSSAELRIISDVTEYPRRSAPRSLVAVLGGSGSAVIIPLSSYGATFGLLGLAFNNRRRFSAQTNQLFGIVAEIAGASLRRAVVLEGLEKQVNVRTQHLSTLYRINTAAGEPLPLDELLQRVVDTTCEALKCRATCIHLVDQAAEYLNLAAQTGLAAQAEIDMSQMSLHHPFWDKLLSASDALIVPDLAGHPAALAALSPAAQPVGTGYIGAPVRVKGQPIGVLSLFGAAVGSYSEEEIKLFTAIADQVGGLVERSRLTRQAEMAAVVQERQRLARELHDSVTQLLYSQVLFSGAGRKELRQGKPVQAESHLARIEGAAQQALKEMRLLVFELRPPSELEEGLPAAVERRLEAVERRTGMVARLIVNGEADLQRDVRLELYRIVEEALNNTLKHAGAATVLVALRFSLGEVQLEVADDGRGFDVTAPREGGMGLANMKARATALGGELVIESEPGQGTRVSVRLKV